MVGIDLLVIFALAAWVTKVVTTHRVEHEYAKRGETPPRVQLQIDRFKAGERATEPARPGARGYLSELWHDCWDDMTERHRRIRAERKAAKDSPRSDVEPTAERQRLRDVAVGWWRWLWTPLGEDRNGDQQPPAAPPPPPANPPQQRAAATAAPQPVAPVPASDPVVPPPTPQPEPPTDTTKETAVTAPTTSPDEIATNEAARRSFAAMRAAAAKANDALVALESARDEMARHAKALADGVSAKRFDAGATAAANDAAANITSATLADWAERVDTVAEQAAIGHAALDKYRDGEDLVATQNVDASTMDAAAA